MDAEESQIDPLLERTRRQDRSARHALLEAHRPRLRRLAEVWLDDRLSARVDPSDVVQETLMEASQRLDEFFQDEEVPVYIWLRQHAYRDNPSYPAQRIKKPGIGVANPEPGSI